MLPVAAILLRQLLQSNVADALGLALTHCGAAGDDAVGQSQGHGHIAHALASAGELTGHACAAGLSRSGSRLLHHIVTQQSQQHNSHQRHQRHNALGICFHVFSFLQLHSGILLPCGDCSSIFLVYISVKRELLIRKAAPFAERY